MLPLRAIDIRQPLTLYLFLFLPHSTLTATIKISCSYTISYNYYDTSYAAIDMLWSTGSHTGTSLDYVIIQYPYSLYAPQKTFPKASKRISQHLTDQIKQTVKKTEKIFTMAKYKYSLTTAETVC